MAKTKTILVVDDEVAIAVGLVNSLKAADAGIEAVARFDAETALEDLKRGSVDLLITDFRLPGMDGCELLQKARALDPKLAVIMITGHGRPDLKSDAMRAGAAAFIEKPFNTQALIEMALAVTGGGKTSVKPKFGEGVLEGLELSDILQIFSLRGLDRTVVLLKGELVGTVFMQGGRTVHAETGELTGFEALGEMLTWREPEIEVHAACMTGGEHTIDMPSTQLALLEASRLADEKTAGGPLEGGGDIGSILDGMDITEEAFTREERAPEPVPPAEPPRSEPPQGASPERAAPPPVLDAEVPNRFDSLIEAASHEAPGLVTAYLVAYPGGGSLHAWSAGGPGNASLAGPAFTELVELLTEGLRELALGDLEWVWMRGTEGAASAIPAGRTAMTALGFDGATSTGPALAVTSSLGSGIGEIWVEGKG